MSEPVVIVAAVNGGMQVSRDGAKVPITPDEIAEAARLCREAGAAIVHVHARDERGRNTGDIEVFRDIIRRIRDRSDILIQTTNGIGVRRDPTTGEMIWPTDEERLALVTLDPSPDLYGVAAGSTDFLHPEGGYHEETPYVNSPHFLKETIQAVYAKGSTLEYEIVDTHALHRLSQYADDGIFDRNAGYIWLLYGGGLCFTPTDGDFLSYLRRTGERLFPNALWGVIGGGRANYTWPRSASRWAAPPPGSGSRMGCTFRTGGLPSAITTLSRSSWRLLKSSAAARQHRTRRVRSWACVGRRSRSPPEVLITRDVEIPDRGSASCSAAPTPRICWSP